MSLIIEKQILREFETCSIERKSELVEIAKTYELNELSEKLKANIETYKKTVPKYETALIKFYPLGRDEHCKDSEINSNQILKL